MGTGGSVTEISAELCTYVISVQAIASLHIAITTFVKFGARLAVYFLFRLQSYKQIYKI